MFFIKRKNKKKEPIKEKDEKIEANVTEIEKPKEIRDDKEDVVWIQRMVSHNVRMPMSIIRGYGDLLKGGLLNEKEKEDAIKSICDNIMYLDQILNVIFEYDKHEYVNLSKVDVAYVLQCVVGYVKNMSVKNKIKIELKLPSNKLYINAEATSVIRMIYQLLENAFKYLNEGGVITLSAYKAENQILIVYKDNGYGMSDHEVHRVMENGFRGANATYKSGSGFGMYDLQNTIKKFNGTVEVKSKPGKGFSVFMLFPVVEFEDAE